MHLSVDAYRAMALGVVKPGCNSVSPFTKTKANHLAEYWEIA